VSTAATDEAILAAAGRVTDPTRPLPFTFAKRFGVLVRSLSDAEADVVIREGVSPLSVAEVRRHLRRRLKLERVDAERFEVLLREAYEAGSGTAMDAMGGLEGETDLANLAQEIPEPSDLLESEDEAPVIRLINALLTQAVKENGSDIHIEPFENRLVIRYRVDGVLREVLQTKRALAPLLVSRIKVMSRLDIAEKRLPQDGRISLRIAGRAVDVRVSTIPAGHGERVVLRLLDKQAGRLDLDSLGMDIATQRLVDDLIHKPNGILLVTGPTGSGKTTTLYAALSEIKSIEDKIVTIEDPVEYQLRGITQIPINEKKGLTFARGLRSILRHDPDKIMVGEIRDPETAQIAIQSALTGHLVFTTVHANNVIDVLGRFLNMGVEPYQFVSALNCVLAQRLVRLICQECKRAVKIDEAFLLESGMDPSLSRTHTFYEGSGCIECGGTGFKGRMAICELLDLTDRIRDMILARAPNSEIKKAARDEGMRFLRESAVERAMLGYTTLREINKVTFVE
jgi:type II secretion system protein E